MNVSVQSMVVSIGNDPLTAAECPGRRPLVLGVVAHADRRVPPEAARPAIRRDWMARATKMFLWMIPGEARVQPVAELEDAKAWVAGGASQPRRPAGLS